MHRPILGCLHKYFGEWAGKLGGGQKSVDTLQRGREAEKLTTLQRGGGAGSKKFLKTQREGGGIKKVNTKGAFPPNT